jgi:hypothetical protein
MKAFIGIILFSIVGWAKTSEPNFVIIANTTYKYESKLECEFTAAISPDNNTIRVARLDHFKGTYNASYFARENSKFRDYGTSFDIDSEFNLHGQIPAEVTAAFDFDQNKHDLVLKISGRNSLGQKVEMDKKTIPLDDLFFKDHPKNCLK